MHKQTFVFSWDTALDEINQKAWTCIENQFGDHLLEKTPSKLWKELMIDLGDEFIIWANAPEDPVMN